MTSLFPSPLWERARVREKPDLSNTTLLPSFLREREGSLARRRLPLILCPDEVEG
jgi:hypothetical protein